MSGGFTDSLTPEAATSILEGVRAGAYLAVACRAAGVSRDAVKYWRRRRREGKPLCSWPRYRSTRENSRLNEFLDEMERIDAEIECGLVAKVSEGRPGWRAAAWELERRYPTRWGRGKRRAAV